MTTLVGPDLLEPRCLIVELRQYTLHRGRRDTLITLFDHEFVEPQEAAGMRVIGQYRDLKLEAHPAHSLASVAIDLSLPLIAPPRLLRLAPTTRSRF